jgi:hypothetical protein
MTKRTVPPGGGDDIEAAKDPYNPANFRLDQTFGQHIAYKKLLTTIPVRKPNRQDWSMVCAEENYCLTPAAIIELKDEREIYLLTPQVAAEIPDEIATVTLHLAITRQGVVTVWPVKLPGPDGKPNPWHQSAAEGAERAKKRWIKLTSNMALGAYEITEATGKLGQPVWPDLSLQEILKIAFRDRIIETADHPVIQRLKGAI